MAIMTARYAGKCAATGATIRPGDTIDYDRRTRKARLASSVDADPSVDADRNTGDNFVGRPDPLDPHDRYVSHVFTIGGREYYRNKRGRCEDAPCCGCCTI